MDLHHTLCWKNNFRFGVELTFSMLKSFIIYSFYSNNTQILLIKITLNGNNLSNTCKLNNIYFACIINNVYTKVVRIYITEIQLFTNNINICLWVTISCSKNLDINQTHSLQKRCKYIILYISATCKIQITSKFLLMFILLPEMKTLLVGNSLKRA